MKKAQLFTLKSYIHFILLTFSTSIFAETDITVKSCSNQYSGSELSACLDNVRSRTEKELVIWVNNQTFVLDTIKQETGKGAALKLFKRSMNRFNTYREDNCRWQYLTIVPAKGADIAYKKCYIELTQTKINELSKLSRQG